MRPSSRRAVVLGAVWSTPVIAVAGAAPAYALSLCPPVTLDWSSQPNNARFTSTTVGTAPNTTAVSMTITESTGATASNGFVVTTTQGGVAGEQLLLNLVPNQGNPAATTVVFNFVPVVAQVTLQIRDIDVSGTNWSDRITPSAGYTVVSQGTTVTTPAPGTFGGNVNVAPTEATGNLTLRWAGPLTSISLRYFQAATGGTGALVTIGDLTFRPSVC